MRAALGRTGGVDERGGVGGAEHVGDGLPSVGGAVRNTATYLGTMSEASILLFAREGVHLGSAISYLIISGCEPVAFCSFLGPDLVRGGLLLGHRQSISGCESTFSILVHVSFSLAPGVLLSRLSAP